MNAADASPPAGTIENSSRVPSGDQAAPHAYPSIPSPDNGVPSPSGETIRSAPSVDPATIVCPSGDQSQAIPESAMFGARK